MKYYSHVNEENGTRTGTKLIREHAENVFNIACHSVYPGKNIGISISETKSILKDITYLHDLGKYTSYFQQYLFGEKVNPEKLKNHSHIGAFFILNKYAGHPVYAGFFYFIILNHHNSFNNIKKTGLFADDIKENNIINRQFKNLLEKAGQITNELKEPSLQENLAIPELAKQKLIRQTIIKRIIKSPAIQDYFTINYLFSLLIEADKLDASGTPVYVRKDLPENAVENFIGKAELSKLPQIEAIDGFEQNKLRNWVRASVLENLKDKRILEKKLFTFTAPTGIGKTLTALDFALHLKKKISLQENVQPQIIYGLPFINIIEQGLKVYHDVFKGSDTKILGHYQYADVFGRSEEGKQNNENGKDYNKNLMQLNTWQSDIVITSFVQFFETLISNRNKMLLKFHHLAGAIVILDEVQTLRLEQLPFIGAVLYYLTKYLNTRIILMTATKPKIFELANREILHPEGEEALSAELLRNHEKVFKKFNRTKLVPILDKPLVTADDFYNLFVSKRTGENSCLIVCNTVQRSIDIFNKLKEKGITHLYYLSTNIVPAVRFQIIRRIKEDIIVGKAPVLVSTQVVEAGVDLDFDMGFRDLGPIDSIIQVAGRINRENHKSRELSPLYIVEFQSEKGTYESTLVYDSLTRQQVKDILKGISEIPETNYLQLVENYFSGLSGKEAFDESRNYYKAMKTLKYHSNENSEPSVSRFKIIKDSPWAVSVFIELNGEATRALKAYSALMNKEMTKKEFDKGYKKVFNQYIIAVPKKFTEHLENISDTNENIKLVRKELIESNYHQDTGFIRTAEPDDKVVML